MGAFTTAAIVTSLVVSAGATTYVGVSQLNAAKAARRSQENLENRRKLELEKQQSARTAAAVKAQSAGRRAGASQRGSLVGGVGFGSGNITNDLALGLKTSVEAAEAIKFSFGAALAKDTPAREMIDLKKIDSRAKGQTARRFVAEIIEARLSEIFECVNKELQRIERAAKLPAGAILVGGGAKLPGLVDLVKQELRLPAQVGIPDVSMMEVKSGELALQIEDPEFACCIGLLMWGNEKFTEPGRGPSAIKSVAKKWLEYFIP